jgi:hypothetical protein
MRFKKLWRFSSIALCCLALSIDLFLSLQSPRHPQPKNRGRWRLPPSRGAAARLGTVYLPSMLTVLMSVIYELAWSYESQQIAFTFNEIPGNKSSLYVINRAGSGLTKLTNNQDLNASNPVWKPQ